MTISLAANAFLLDYFSQKMYVYVFVCSWLELNNKDTPYSRALKNIKATGNV